MEFEFGEGEQVARLKRLFTGLHQIRFYYSRASQLERIIDSTGRKINVVEGPGGRLISLTLEGTQARPLLASYQYDAVGNLLAITNSTGSVHSFQYDDAKRMVIQTGRKGFRFYFDYDREGRCIRSRGDEGLYEVALHYKIPGRLTKVTRADGGVWTYFFDPNGGLIQIRDPLGGMQKFLRDEAGRVAVELDQNQNLTRIIYDRSGEAIAKVDPLRRRIALPVIRNAANPRPHRVAANPFEFEYGRLFSEEEIKLPHRAEALALTLSPHAKKLVFVAGGLAGIPLEETRFRVCPIGTLWWPGPRQGRIFNDLGVLTQQRDEYGRIRTWTYDASENVLRYADFDGGTWSYDNGAWHLLRGVKNSIGAEVRFTYTSSGKVASCTDAGGSLSEYRYNLNDHLIEVKRHGVVRETYERDPCGNLVAKRATNGRLLLSAEIGPGNVPVKETFASGDELVFQYDKSGRYVVAATQRDLVEFAYDANGNRVADKRGGQGVIHQFEASPKRSRTIFFDRFSTNYERDNRRTLVIRDPSGKSHRCRFCSNGLVERFFSNGTRETAQYDARRRCLFKSVDRGAGTVWNRRYHWSGEGELRHVEDNLSGEVRYEYDAAHRLRCRFVAGRAEEYRFDCADNLLAQPGLEGVTLGQGNRLEAANGYAFEYNDRNHVQARETADGLIRYFYDSRDLLIRCESPNGLWEAQYDALGRRTRKTWKGDTTEFFWNTDQLIAEVRADGRVRLYIYADSLALSPILFIDYPSLDAQPDSGRRYFIFGDQIGTPRFVENENGVEVWRAQVEPFGRVQIAPRAQIDVNLRFPGHYFDPELGLHYNRFRYYDPSLGRYLQSDPWGIAGGINLYAYRSNPLLEVDARGLGGGNSEEHDPESEKKPLAESTTAKADPPPDEGPTVAAVAASSEEEPTAFPGLERGGGSTNEHADRVADALSETQPAVRSSNRSVTVVEHEDQTVSVGLSGGDPKRAQDAQQVVDTLNEKYPNDPPTYRTTDGDVDTSRLKQGPAGSPAPGVCSEAQAAQASQDYAAQPDGSPPKSYQTVWTGPKPSGYETGGEPTPGGNSPMTPCKTCQGNGPAYTSPPPGTSDPPSGGQEPSS